MTPHRYLFDPRVDAADAAVFGNKVIGNSMASTIAARHFVGPAERAESFYVRINPSERPTTHDVDEVFAGLDSEGIDSDGARRWTIITSPAGLATYAAARAHGASVSDALSAVLELRDPETHAGHVQKLVDLHAANERDAASMLASGAWLDTYAQHRGIDVEDARHDLAERAGLGGAPPMSTIQASAIRGDLSHGARAASAAGSWAKRHPFGAVAVCGVAAACIYRLLRA